MGKEGVRFKLPTDKGVRVEEGGKKGGVKCYLPDSLLWDAMGGKIA